MTSIPPVAPNPRPILARASENGLWLSIYITVLALSLGVSASFVPAQLIVWAGSAAMPFFLFRLLRRSAIEDGNISFVELWAEGISSFFLGTLIPALVVYVCLRFVAPTFVLDTFNDTVEQLIAVGTPEAMSLVEMISELISKGMVPTAVDVVAELISFNFIIGTFMSLFIAALVKLRTTRMKKYENTF